MIQLIHLRSKIASSFRRRRDGHFPTLTTKQGKNKKDVKRNQEKLKTVLIMSRGEEETVFDNDLCSHQQQLRPRLVRFRSKKDLIEKQQLSINKNRRRNRNNRFMANAKGPLVLLARAFSARILFKRSKHDANNTSSDDGWTIASSQDNDEEISRLLEEASELDQTGNDLLQQGRYQDSLKYYMQALRYKDQTLKSDNVVNDNEDDDSITEEKKEEVFKPPLISTRMKNQLLASVATSINNIGYLRQKLGDTTSEDIMSAYEDSLGIKRKILGKNDLSIGTTLNNIATVHFHNKNNEEAMKLYQEALDIMVLNLGMYHLDVATMHSNIGDVYAATEKLDAARMSYEEALNIRWTELGSTDPRTTRLLERIAEIDMAETTRNLVERPATIVERKTSEDYYPAEDTPTSLADDIYDNVVSMEELKRSLELEMFRDKIEMICEMREL